MEEWPSLCYAQDAAGAKSNEIEECHSTKSFISPLLFLKYGASRGKQLKDWSQEEIYDAFKAVKESKIMWERFDMNKLFNLDPGDGSLSDLKVHSMRSFVALGFPI